MAPSNLDRRDPSQPQVDRGRRFGGHCGCDAPLLRLHLCSAVPHQFETDFGRLQTLDAGIFRMRAPNQGSLAFEIGDDDAHGRGGQALDPRNVGAADAWRVGDDLKHRELRRRELQGRQLPLHGGSMRRGGATQEVVDPGIHIAPMWTPAPASALPFFGH
jgi:hypothetical protein